MLFGLVACARAATYHDPQTILSAEFLNGGQRNWPPVASQSKPRPRAPKKRLCGQLSETELLSVEENGDVADLGDHRQGAAGSLMLAFVLAFHAIRIG